MRFDGMMSRARDDRPKYIILSHTWRDEEVTFSDMANTEAAKLKKGWGKIEGICEQARRRRIDYAWVDTCCIDKSSSAELTEAINSMYAYYREAFVCIAYLDDVFPGDLTSFRLQLASCRWFTRGWTLQELIAPKDLEFYDASWEFRSSAHEPEAMDVVHLVTKIDERVLGNERRPLDEISVAQKMSWAAGRSTTRIEDRAYSLMGIFGVNMPLIYGEGERAFRRLQEAILQQTNDLSIFAWNEPEEFGGVCGFLAQRPEAFAIAGFIELMGDPNIPDPSFTVTNAAVEMSTSLCTYKGRELIYWSGPRMLAEAENPTKDPESGYRLLHLHCKVMGGPRTDSSQAREDAPYIVFLLLMRIRNGWVRNRSMGPCLIRQTAVRFLEPVEVVMPKVFSRTVGMDLYFSEVIIIDLSSVKAFLNNWRMMPARYSVKAKYYPEHLCDVRWNDGFVIHDNPHFVGAVQIQCTGEQVGKDEEPPNPRHNCFWLVCGKSCPREDGETEIWATMYTRDMVESGQLARIGVFCEGDLRNPLAISNIGYHLRELQQRPDWGETVETSQKLTMPIGTEVVEILWTSTRVREELDSVSKHTIHILGGDRWPLRGYLPQHSQTAKESSESD